MKTSYFNKLAIVLFIQLGIATSISSEEHSKHKHKEETETPKKTEATQERVQHDSHEHGKARLTMAKTEVGMEITLDTPAANIFGFGHPASDKKEHAIVQTATEKLNAGTTLFITDNAANCTLKDIDIQSDIISAHKDNDHADKEDHKDNDKDHKDNDHADKEDHKDNDKDHKDNDHADKEEHKDHKDHDHDKETHSDVEVTWMFQCEKPKALSSVEVKLFSQFPKGFQQLNLEWITNNNGAGTTTLEANGTVKLGK